MVSGGSSNPDGKIFFGAKDGKNQEAKRRKEITISMARPVLL